MNDHDAMEAVNAALEEYFSGQLESVETLIKIARITGENKIEHAEARQAKS